MSLLITRGLGSGPGLIIQGLEAEESPAPIPVNGVLLFDPFKIERQRGIQFANVLDKSPGQDADIGGAPGPAREHTNARMGVYMASQGVGLRAPQGGSYSGAIKYRFRNARTFPIPNSILGQGSEVFPFTGGPAPYIPSFCSFTWNTGSDFPEPTLRTGVSAMAKFNDGRVAILNSSVSGSDNSVTRAAIVWSADGRSVVTGGFSTEPNASSSLFYIGGPFCATGDGRILHVGETISGSSFVDSFAETLDPVTLQFTARPQPPGNIRAGFFNAPLEQFTLTKLVDGNVLMLGGIINNSNVSSGSNIYNIASDLWTVSASMIEARRSHTTVLLNDGRVFTAGGIADQTDAIMSSSEIWNPRTNVWSAAAAMHKARQSHAAVTLPDGKVLVFGNGNAFDPTGSMEGEVWDPGTNTWTFTPSLSASIYFANLVVAGDGHAYIIGGFQFGGGQLTGAIAYDSTNNAWYPRSGTLYSYQRGNNQTVLLLSGCTLFAAGGSSGSLILAKTELSTP